MYLTSSTSPPTNLTERDSFTELYNLQSSHRGLDRGARQERDSFIELHRASQSFTEELYNFTDLYRFTELCNFTDLYSFTELYDSITATSHRELGLTYFTTRALEGDAKFLLHYSSSVRATGNVF